MLRLSRTVRFCINPDSGAAGATAGPRNGFAGSPRMQGLGRYYEIDVEAEGEADAVTGYLIDIQSIDRAVRELAVPIIAETCARRPTMDPGAVLPEITTAIAKALGGKASRVRWRLTPYYAVEMSVTDTKRIQIRQRFDFAAAHRLHTPELSDEENRRVYGKCNNPAGHGHNYEWEPVVSVRLEDGAPPFSLADLERVTVASVIDRFDHTHLNKDTPEFAPGSGRTPSVENIAQVCFDLLAPAIAEASDGAAELRGVTVWETDRTSCTYGEA